jgi:hypothetical protein
MRRAAQQAIEQSDVVASTGLPPDMVQQHCYTFYMCGTPYATEFGTEALKTPDDVRLLAPENSQRILIPVSRRSKQPARE